MISNPIMVTYKFPSFHVSTALYNFIGVVENKKVTKFDIARKCIDYAREHNLLDPSNQTRICPDAKLKQLFNLGDNEPMILVCMSKYINPHICSTSYCSG